MRRLITAAALVLLAACGSDSTGPGDNGGNNGGGNNNPNGAMTARVDGQNWSSSVIVSATRNAQFVTIGGANSSALAIAFTIGPLTTAGTGTYVTGSGQPTNMVMTNGANNWVASPLGGSITFNITTLTATEAKGTFSGTVIAGNSNTTPQTRTITNGTFDVKFQNTN